MFKLKYFLSLFFSLFLYFAIILNPQGNLYAQTCGCGTDCPSAYGCFGSYTDALGCHEGTCEQTGCGSNVVCDQPCTECAGDYCAQIANCNPEDPAACFPAGTTITMSSGQKKNIEEVKVGDSVLSQDENGQKTVSVVEDLITPVSDNMCEIGFSDNSILEVTKSHPLYTDSGWRAIDSKASNLENPGVLVSDLSIGNKMLKEDGSELQINTIACRSEKVQTYNLTVDNSHTFFANGFLVHNKRNPPECTWDAVDCPPDRIRVDSYTDSPTGPLANCPIGSAQTYIGDCGTIPNPEDPDNPICVRDDVRTYACCPVGSVAQCANTSIGTYVNTSTSIACSAGDTYITHWVAYIEPRWERSCQTIDDGDNGSYETCGWGYVNYTYYSTRCNNYEIVCSCASVCTVTAPSTPILLSPPNGPSVSTNLVNLNWDNISQTWGNSCTTNNNTYGVYVGTDENNLGFVGSGNSTLNTIPFTGTTGQTYYWQIRASNGTSTTSSAVWSFTINSGPWWQVKDGDVTTNNDIVSAVPTTNYFGIVGTGGFPGVPVYGTTFNLSSTQNLISATRWNVNTTTTQSRIFNYAFFDNLIPDDVNFNNVSTLVSGGTPYTDGYEWYTASGDVSTSGDINIGSRKVILFVENGDLNINGRINVDDGIGFFGSFVDGNIEIAGTVTGAPSIEGIYLADNIFVTGAGTSQLHVRGSVTSFGGTNLQRNLTNNANPAELFEFAPDQMLLFPEKLMFRRTKWTEVAP